MTTYTQFVLVEFHNSFPGIFKFQSKKPINKTNIIHFFNQKDDGFDEDKDSLIFLNSEDITTINI